MDKIAIIIVHYNTPEDTRECLESLDQLRTRDFQYQIFVVDNASREHFVLPKKIKNVQLIRSDTNLGFTGGNNLGFSFASKNYNPDFFLLLNSDTLVKPDFLLQLHHCLKENPDWGLVAPKMYFAAGREFHLDDYQKNQLGKVIWFAGGVIDWDNLLTFHLGVDEVDRGQFDQLTSFDFATGCSFLIRREALATAGVFDDRYFLYYEDSDLNLRVKKLGYQLGFCPQSVIWHKNGSSSQGSGSDLQNFYLTLNRLLFFFTHGHLRVKFRVLRLAWRLFRHGDQVEKKAALNFFLGKFGKQVVI